MLVVRKAVSYSDASIMEVYPVSFTDILAKYRTISFSERDKGERFERLMQAFLKTAPLYAGIFEHVWLWANFPCKVVYSDRPR